MGLPTVEERAASALTRLMARLGDRPADVARRSGLSPSQLSKLTRGAHGVTLTNVEAVLRALGLTWFDLAQELEGPPRAERVLEQNAELRQVIEELRRRRERDRRGGE